MTRFRPALIAALPLSLASLSIGPLAAQDAGAPEVRTEAEAAPAPQTRGEKRLAKLLEGRVAGEPMSCIRTFPSQRMQTIDGTAYVYGSGNTIYVQRTTHPEQIDDNDALVTNRFNASQMCRFDQTRTIDTLTGMLTGVVFFEDFVPYERVKAPAAAEG
jgi:hypothetical protein